MTVTVHSEGKWIILKREGASNLLHGVPRKNKFFKEELRIYRDEIQAWLCGDMCDELIVYKPPRLSFYRRALFSAVLSAIQRQCGLVLISTYIETSPVIR